MDKDRFASLLRRIKKNNLDALLITKPENIFYLTSFHTTSSDEIALSVSPHQNFVFTNFLHAESASKFFKNFKVYVAKDSFVDTIRKALDKQRIKRLGFESSSISYSHFKRINQALNKKDLIATENIVESLREIKDDKEILALKRALKITSQSLDEIIRKLRPGITEKAVARFVKETLIRKGADAYSFEPIVATQPSSSQPHHYSSARKLGRNKAILLDFGAKLDGYNSDLTRLHILGKINTKFSYLYNLVLEAEEKAIERVKPGRRIKEIDLAARQHIENKGLGKYFGHGLGHGIGLETHERPYINAKNSNVLEENMVFTVEPGIYIPGFGGIRIEDTIRVKKDGCEVLTHDIGK